MTDPKVVAVDQAGAPLPPNTTGTSQLAEMVKKQQAEEAAAKKVKIEKEDVTRAGASRAEVPQFTQEQIKAAKEF